MRSEKMSEHYLDNGATTKVSDTAAQKVLEIMLNTYGNPSSLHSMGFVASKELESSRQTIASELSADSSEIIFTSGGTEANNLAILGAADAKKRMGNRIVTTATEHSSVYDTMLSLKAKGFEVIFVSPDSKGNINKNDILSAVNDKTILVSTMLVNNEIGTITPVNEIASVLKRINPDTLLHTDAVQAFGKIPVKVSRLGADLVSISAHKIHGPKGVGALYVKKGVRILPRNFGGAQEKKLRPGTEALPLICGFAQAVKEIDLASTENIVRELNTYLRSKLSEMSDIVINSPENAGPFVLNFSVGGIRSETMLHHLASREIYVSSGSACSKGAKSHVLQAMGLPDDITDSAIRVSFSKYNTLDDCDALIEALREGMNNLAKR